MAPAVAESVGEAGATDAGLDHLGGEGEAGKNPGQVGCFRGHFLLGEMLLKGSNHGLLVPLVGSKCLIALCQTRWEETVPNCE